MGDLTIKPNTQGKIAQTDYDFWLTQSEDRCLYCLSKRQIAILLTALPMSEWRTRWFSPTGADPDMDLIQAEIAKIETELMTDHCDLDATLTAIQNNITTINNNVVTINANITTINTNVTNIDASLTLIDNSVTNIENTVNDITINVNTIFVQNNYLNIDIVNNFNTYIQAKNDDTLTAAYARYNGFCKSMLAWIASAFDTYARAHAYTPLFFAALDAYEAHYTVLNLPKGLIAPVLGGGGMTEADAISAMEDFSAVNDVACAMITYLQNQVPSALTFSNALSAYTPPAYPDNRYIITQLLLATLTLSNSFASWLSIEETYFQEALAENPTDYDCPACVPSGFCAVPYTWDFTNLELPPWVINRGVLTSGVGIVGAQIPGDTNFGIDMSIYFPTPCTALIGHKINVHHAHQVAVGNAWRIEYWYLLAGVPTMYNTSNLSQVASWPALDSTFDLGIPTPPGGVGVYRIRWLANTSYYGGTGSQPSTAATVSKIEFKT